MKAIAFAAIATLCANAGVTLAQATKPAAAAAPTPPPYTPVRWTENYAYLAKTPGTDLFDPIKYIPLGADDVYLSLGGQFRERYEWFNNANFGAGPQDDNGFFLHRLMLHADLHLGKNFRVFAQGKSALIDGREGGPRPTDADEVDVEQLFFDFKFALPTGDKDSSTIRFGRQNLIYGAQRLISPLDWTNVRRTFEGVKVSNVIGTHTLDFFLVRPVIVDKEELNDGDGDQTFAGIYDTIGLPDVFGKAANTKLELYGLALYQQQNATRAIDVDTYTLGVRFSTAPKPWDLDVEADYQFGSSGQGDISAYSLAAEVGYTFADVAFSPRVYIGFDYASGDDDPTNPDKGTFNQLFPLGHAYFGYIDAIGRQNIVDVHPGLQLTLLKDKDYAKSVKLRADYHMFWRAEETDGLYGVAGNLSRPAGGSDETYVGSEFDLLIDWQVDRHLSFYFGYSHFFAGDFLEDTGAAEDVDYIYVAGTYTF
jgi:hypothetical protein